ncbi:MAG TPA: hypothetical protein K8V05_08810 [Butyricimonas virosa]|jgi:hypothetical protein|uniref:Uncharacterized protein n=1 Tax=Butyricimonas virosa TaxID=544645 RepID=A0A921KYN4_9BACT|nr:MAG TPA: hypothetical protein [Caudoviricetes sp.]HJF70837.1 hypothetical protein [Butyricimonas virosa]
MELPHLNKRINDLVDYFCKGNKKEFSSLLNGVSQQRFNRLFIPDPRTNKIPTVPGDIISEILVAYKDVNAEWLMIGEGEMIKENILEDSTNLSKQTFAEDRNSVDIIIKNEIKKTIMENIPAIISAVMQGMNQQMEGQNQIINKQLDMLQDVIKSLATLNTKSDSIQRDVIKLTRKVG